MPYLSYDTGLELFEPTTKIVALAEKVSMSIDEVTTSGLEKLGHKPVVNGKMESKTNGTEDFPMIDSVMSDQDTSMAVQPTPTQITDKNSKPIAPSSAPDLPHRAPPTPPVRKGTLRLEPCPTRLTPYVPPTNWGAVRATQIFRSGFPTDDNLTFLSTIPLKTILTLVETAPSEAYTNLITDNRINRSVVPIAANKEGKISLTWESMCEALLFLMDSTHWPVYAHCNQGKHRTGCVIACLRRVWREPLEEVLDEYHTYSRSKARDADIAFITAFQPDSVFEFAKSHGYLESPRLKRMDSMLADLDSLSEALASGGAVEGDSFGVSDGSSTSDSSAESDVWLGANGGSGGGVGGGAGEGRSLVMRTRSKSSITREKVEEIMGGVSPDPAPMAGVQTTVDELEVGEEEEL